MIICKKCGKQTASGETTGRFVTYAYNIDEDGNTIEGKHGVSEVKTCTSCSGDKLK